MRYLLTGYYGMRNAGDDVLLYVTMAEVAACDTNARFTVISERDEAIPPGAFVRLVQGGRRLESIRQMLRHDVWLFGGGGLLQDTSPRAVKYLQRLGRSAQFVRGLGRRVALVGIGVGPLATADGRTAGRRLLEVADFITVRDEESWHSAMSLAPRVRITITADLACLLPRHLPQAPPSRCEGSRTLGLSLLAHATSVGKKWSTDAERTASMATVLRDVLTQHDEWRVVLFDFFSGSDEYGDGRVLRLLQNQLGLGDRVTYRAYDGDFQALYSQLAGCDAFVGMRFHSCLLAYTAGVPCLVLAYHPKSESLAARLRLPPEALVPLPILEDRQSFTSRLQALLTDAAKFRSPVPIDTMAAQSARNFTLLSSWLAGASA
jgi:polysaccharide pyruvyl transferase CsaB